MAAIGTVHLLAFGFDSPGSLPPGVAHRLHRLHGHGMIRLLDVLLVSRDARGILGLATTVGADLNLSSDPTGSTLWQVLDGNAFETASTAALELHSACEVGLDLEAVESLAYRIEPGTTALLMLVETRWATVLLDEVTSSGGFPIVFGCLQPETMLVVGPQLAAAAEADIAADNIATARAVETLDALACAPGPSSAIAANVIRALVVARIIDPTEVHDSISALADAGIIAPSPIRRRT
jgi:uncharacterized membrane protein